MPDDGFQVTGAQDPTAEDPNLFVQQTAQPTDPNLLGSVQESFTQPANGYAMEAFAPGLDNTDPTVTVTANPQLLEQVDMAGMLPQSEPNFGASSGVGGLFGELCGQFSNQIAEFGNSIQSGEPATVTADLQQQYVAKWTPPTSSIG